MQVFFLRGVSAEVTVASFMLAKPHAFLAGQLFSLPSSFLPLPLPSSFPSLFASLIPSFFFASILIKLVLFFFHPIGLEGKNERWLHPMMACLFLETCFYNYSGFDVYVSILGAIPGCYS